MRSRSYYAVSSVLALLGSLAACDSPAKHREDKKAEAKADLKDRSDRRIDGLIAPLNIEPDDPVEAEPIQESLSSRCPDGQTTMGDGSCAPEEDFYAEQEVLDERVIAEIQTADTAQAQVKAQEHFIESQARQIEKAEEDLDEIIRDLKRKKRSKKPDPLEDPL